MKVSYCEKCKCYERRTWSDYHIPKNYHPIGMSHAYGYCKLYCMRCSEIKPYICKERLLKQLTVGEGERMDAVRMIMEAECKCEHGNITVGECAKILAPLHDVEPVVRCKDCNLVTMFETADGQTLCECGVTTSFHKPDWFCADGKRKEG